MCNSRPPRARPRPGPRAASPPAEGGDGAEPENVEGERSLVAALVNDHLHAFKDSSAAVGLPWNDRAGGATSKLAEMLDEVLEKTDAVAELCQAMRHELLRAVSDEGRAQIHTAFRKACIQTHVVYNLQLDRVHGTQSEANTLLANAGFARTEAGQAPGLDLAEEVEPLAERYVQELACEVAELFFGDHAPTTAVADDASSASDGDDGDDDGDDCEDCESEESEGESESDAEPCDSDGEVELGSDDSETDESGDESGDGEGDAPAARAEDDEGEGEGESEGEGEDEDEDAEAAALVREAAELAAMARGLDSD